MKTYLIKAKAKSISQSGVDILVLVSINTNIYDAVAYLRDDLPRRHHCEIVYIEAINFIEESDDIKVPRVEYLNPV